MLLSFGTEPQGILRQVKKTGTAGTTIIHHVKENPQVSQTALVVGVDLLTADLIQL